MKNKKRHYKIIKNKYDRKKISLDEKKLVGFSVKPRNNVYYSGVEVNRMMLVNRNFIQTVLKKKIKRKLDLYLQYIVDIMNDSDEDSGTTIRFALNDLEKYRSIIENNYKKYLEQKYIEQLLKKIRLIEHELRVKEYYVSQYSMSLQEERGKSR